VLIYGGVLTGTECKPGFSGVSYSNSSIFSQASNLTTVPTSFSLYCDGQELKVSNLGMFLGSAATDSDRGENSVHF
jgi:hypothetical protein